MLPTYLGQYPDEAENGWSHEAQGISHDDMHWYITQRDRLWKFPVSHDLASHVAGPDPERGILSIGIPTELTKKGYNHFGDLDCVDGFLFVPLEGPQLVPLLCRFATKSLSYLGAIPMKEQSQAGWCAIDPSASRLFSSDSTVDAKNPIRIYALESGKSLKLIGKLPLRWIRFGFIRSYPTLRTMQGGVLAPDGRLYVVNGNEQDSSSHGGIWIVDPQSGQIIARSSTTKMPFKYEFHPGRWKYEEPEGITWWDLDDDRAPNIRGQLHVMMLDNDRGTDDVYVNHYRIGNL